MSDKDKPAERETSPPGDGDAAASSRQGLHQRAEARLLQKAPLSPESLEALSPAAARQMLHELRVHQIELEMQNEELRESQAALDAVRERYFDLYDLAPVGYCTVSEQGLIMQANLTAAGLLGVVRGALVKKLLSQFIVKADQDLYYLHRKKLLETGEAQTCELRMVKNDGTEFWVHLAATAAQDADGAPELRAVLSDVTARKRVETALAKADALQSAIFNSVYFSSIATDAKGVIQIFNVGAERMLGYTAAEVMNKITPADFSDPQEVIVRAKVLSAELGTKIAPGFEALVFKAARGIEDIYEQTYIRKDGSRFPAVVSVTALRNAQNVILGYLLIGTDNTVRKAAQEAHQTSEQRLNSLVASVLDAIIAIDANHCITLFNPAAERMFGLTAGEVLGSSLDRLIPHRFRSTHSDRIHQFEETKVSARSMGNTGQIFGLHADGKEFPIDASIAQHEVNGEKIFTAVLRDVTERERLYQMLQERNVAMESAKSMAEKASLAKSEFLSSMSHELRTPLHAILGFAQLLEAGSPLPTTTQKGKIDQITKAGWHLLDLINEILDLTLIESGKLSLSQEPMSLAEVMHECQAMIEPQAESRGIRMTFSQFETPYFVKADRTRVKQVLVNLLSNAIKYNKVGGTVGVDCTASSAGRIRICVKDTGDGLTAGKLTQLFQPFNRLGKETGVEEGTGIGLVVSKQLVELMGGEIGVESTVGVGSVFWFELNLTAEPQPAAAAKPTAVAPAQVQGAAPLRTLLYVEDNPANLLLVEEIIARRPDIRFLSAADGNRGVEMARASQPDVILMDINLPGISGIQAMNSLAQDPATAHIPVIALSANAMPRDIGKGLEAGFFCYLTKPIKVDEFMDTLDVALKFAQTQAARAVRKEQT